LCDRVNPANTSTSLGLTNANHSEVNALVANGDNGDDVTSKNAEMSHGEKDVGDDSNKASSGAAHKADIISQTTSVSATDATGNASVEGARRDEQKTNGDNGKSTTSAPDTQTLPVLKGTLSYNEVSGRHILRGMWNFESGSDFAAQRFELNRSLDPKEDPTILPKDGVFHGTFSLAYFHTISKGKRREKSKVIHEKDVHIYFKKQEGKVDEYDVNGKGTNQFGVFHINGVAIKDEFEKEPQYKVELRKIYITPPNGASNPPPSKKSKSDSDGKKRKISNISDKGEDLTDPPRDDGPLPPPYESFTSNVYCLRGKLAQTSSDQDGVNHKVSGLWSSSPDFIESDPENVNGQCNLFEFEHHSTTEHAIFPLSGKYPGWFNISKEDGSRTRIIERDITLKFRKNNAGYHNVEGKGSNAFGKYTISGTLDKDNIITIFRHFHQLKRKIPVAQSTTATMNGSASANRGEMETGDPPQMTLDDVIVEHQDSYEPIIPPPDGEYASLSRGILHINPNEESHTCSGKWVMTRSQYNIPNMASNFNFSLEAHHIPLAAKEMKQNGLVKMDESVVFPVDSANYKGSFKMKCGTAKHQSIIDKQIVLKFRKNIKGSYNVYGKGINSLGIFKLVGILVLNSPTGGQVEIYRTYEPNITKLPSIPTLAPVQPLRQSKTLPLASRALPSRMGGSMDIPSVPDSVNSSTPLVSSQVPNLGLAVGIRRESSRQTKLPSRLEDNDPSAQKLRVMEKCMSILKAMSLKDGSSGRFFLEPVDPVAHGIPTYHQIITNPMDLGTIQAKMDGDEIESPEEFARLVRLVFENALKFNVDPTHAVHQAAHDLLVLFNQKFRDVERMTEKKKPSKPEQKEKKRSQQDDKKGLDKKRKKKDSNVENSESKKIELLQSSSQEVATALDALTSSLETEYAPLLNVLKLMHNQITLIQGTLLSSLKMQSKKPFSSIAHDTTASIFSASTVAVDTSAEKKPKKKKPKQKQKEVKETPPVAEPILPPAPVPSITFPTEEKPLTLDEQQNLTEAINEMPEEKQRTIIDIIKESAHINAEDEEIDLEIDQLDTVTQRKLQTFVLKNKPKQKRGKTPKKSVAHTSPVKVEPEKSEPTVETTPKSISNNNESGAFTFGSDGSESDVSVAEETGSIDEPSDGIASKWIIPPPDESDHDESDNTDEDDGSWEKAREVSEKQIARKKHKAARDKKEEAEQKRNQEKRDAEIAAKVRQKKEESKKIKEEEDRVRLEKEKDEKDRVEKLRQAVIDSTDIKKSINLDDNRDVMEDYAQDYGCGGDSPASSNFGF